MDWANLETMAESRRRGLRDLLRVTTIADRPAVYRALVAFVEEHRKSR